MNKFRLSSLNAVLEAVMPQHPMITMGVATIEYIDDMLVI